MILIVNLNPAMDKIYTLKDFKINKIHRTSTVLNQAGGKGINVARASKILNGDSLLTGIMGGFTADFILDDLRKSAIPNDFYLSEKESRSCLIFIDPDNRSQTVVNEDGPAFTHSDLDSFIAHFTELVKNKTLLVLSGSVPASISRDVYNELVEIARNHNTKAIVDTSSKALKLIISARPFMLKPNIYELAELYSDTSLVTETMRENFSPLLIKCSELLDKGITCLVISMGSLGALYCDKNKTFRVIPPEISEVNSVASGDAMTAAIALELDNNKSVEEALISGVAAGTANATIGGLKFTIQTYLSIRERTKIVTIDRENISYV